MLAAATVAVSRLRVPTAAVEPLSPDRYKLQLTMTGDTLEKLRLAKDMLESSGAAHSWERVAIAAASVGS